VTSRSRPVSVVVPVPQLGPLTYEVPETLPFPPVGARVLVPLGSRLLTGCVVPASLGSVATELRAVIDVFDSEPWLPATVVDLALWVADYYACGPGEAVAAAMPPRSWVVGDRKARLTKAGQSAVGDGRRGALLDALREGGASVSALARTLGGGTHALVSGLAGEGLVEVSQPLQGRRSAFRRARTAAITDEGRTLLTSGGRLGSRQREVLERLRGEAAGVLVTRLGVASASLQSLAARNAIRVWQEVVERDPWANDTLPRDGGVEPPKLTSDQGRVVAALAAALDGGSFGVSLLHGVTGSGKTEVYLQLARSAVDMGRQALILVPEIGLTPVIASRFRSRFGERVAVQHSGLSDGARHDQWHRIRRGKVDVVVGTRSAVFTPLERLGLIVVDEEHDGSYKQEESPRYHGRDVAVMRAKRSGAFAVLGSATPSIESYQHTQNERYQLKTLPQRVSARPLPRVHVVDMRDEFAERGPDVVLSSALERGLAGRLEREEQALVLLNRRGFATTVFCRQCGRSVECPNCTVSLTFHRRDNLARCHYCDYSRSRPGVCPACGGGFLEQSGFGTERVEAEIQALSPSARIGRLDRDTVRRQGAAAELLHRFAGGELDVLVGTQMVAKGHDFPRVTLVGVVSADVGLGLADFRAAERTFQLLTQVAGRAGRGEIPGEAIIQTVHPDHYSIRCACSQAYEPFFEEERRYRSAMRYPPEVALVSVVIRAKTAAQAMDDAGTLASRLRQQPSHYEVLGPAPAPLSRLRGQHRVQTLVKGPQRREMREAIQAVFLDLPEIGRRAVVDVDPVSML